MAVRRVLGLPEARCQFDITCPGCQQPLSSQQEAVLHYPACGGPVATAMLGDGGDLYGAQMVHTALKRVVARILTEAGCTALAEVPGLFDGSSERPGDVVVLGFNDGPTHLAIDVSCIKVITNTYLDIAASAPGNEMEAAEAAKRAKYADHLDAAGGSVHFVPFVVNEFGGIGEHGQQLLETLAHRAAERPATATDCAGESRGARVADLARRWRGYVAVAVHRTMALIVIMMAARAGKGIRPTTAGAAPLETS